MCNKIQAFSSESLPKVKKSRLKWAKICFHINMGDMALLFMRKPTIIQKKTHLHVTLPPSTMDCPYLSKRVFPTGGWLSCKRSDHFVLL